MLHEAVLQFENDIVRHLIYKGANVTAVNTENKNRQPMQEAVLNHNYDAIGSLIEKGADMNTVDDDGNTPLILACRPPSREVKSRRRKRALETDAFGNDALNIDERWAGSVTVNCTDPAYTNLPSCNKLDDKDEEDKPELQSEEQMILLCIEHGADVNANNNWGRQAIHTAAFYGYDELMKILIDAGANINATDNNGNTPSHDAARGENDLTDREVYLGTASDTEVQSREKRSAWDTGGTVIQLNCTQGRRIGSVK